MEVLERAETPDGIKIQLEQWESTFKNSLVIGAYPLCKALPQGKVAYFTDLYRPMRVTINRNFESDEAIKTAFESLKSGEKEIKDFEKNFWDLWQINCI